MDAVDQIIKKLEENPELPPQAVLESSELKALEELKGKNRTSKMRLTRPRVQGRFGCDAGDYVGLGSSTVQKYSAADVTQLFLEGRGLDPGVPDALVALADPQQHELDNIAAEIFEDQQVQPLGSVVMVPEGICKRFV